ncbi:MAG: hypothetical protein ACJ0G9_09150 [Alphaproteobacteria bacterium]
MSLKKIFENLEYKILIFISFIFPWSIIMATPQLHIGYWGQVEGMIVFNHFLSGIVALLLLRIGFIKRNLRIIFIHPIVLLPALIGIYSVISALFQRLPLFAIYGSPQLGQGAFWYFSLSLLTVMYFYISQNRIIKLLLSVNFLFITLVITIGSFYPKITGIVISFFGFNDWLAIYFTAFILLVLYLIDTYNFKIKKDFFSLLIFFILGPLFIKIDNNSSIALWILIIIGWIFWLFGSYSKIKLIYLNKLIYNPIFFTAIPIVLSIIMVISSYIFWDGKTDMTDDITNSLGHLATLVARGSIVRVLFEHLISFKALLFGYGWGSISELLIKSFTPEVFYQINTGNRVHFHTHNELFEHVFSIGLVGAFLYISYIFNVFKYSFKISISIAFLWLLYFCIGAFWFSWISTITFQAMLASFLICQNFELSTNFGKKLKFLFNSSYFYSFYLVFMSLFLFYGAYIGYFTAYNHEGSLRSNSLIEIASNSKNTGLCSDKIDDYGKGALQYSQKFNGYNNYFKDQIMLYGVLNKTDYQVLDWHLCASNEIILANKASVELINVHINVLSTISILPGKLGENTRLLTQKYLDLWENKLLLLLSLAPKRVDQATPLIAYYLNKGNDNGIIRICKNLSKGDYYQGYCDLALGSIAIKEGRLNQGLFLIKKARDLGVLDSEDIDKETADYLKNILKEYGE